MENKREDLPEDQELRNLIQRAARTLPDPDFDTRVMLKIQQEQDHKKQVMIQLKTSIRFFAVASVAGIMLALMLVFWFDSEISGKLSLAPIALFLFLVLAIVSFENYRRLKRFYI